MHSYARRDKLTRYALAIPLRCTNSVAQGFVECFVCIYGIPTSILTDRGTNFLSDLFKQMCKLLNIDKSSVLKYLGKSIPILF